MYFSFAFNCHEAHVCHFLFFIVGATIQIITPCSFHCFLVMMILLFVLKKWIIYFDVSFFVAFETFWKFLVWIFFILIFLKIWESFVSLFFFLRKFRDCLVISISLSSSSTTWCTVLNSKIFYGFSSFRSSMMISCVIKELMISLNGSFVRPLTSQITVTLAS